eukprot:Platyproteum_vivax@DN6419_c0_g1_i4.p1
MKSQRDYKECFDLFDQDHDERLATNQLGTVLRSLGQKWTEKELQTLYEELGDVLIDYAEFLEIAERKQDTEDETESLVAAFQVFDRAGSGTVGVSHTPHCE